MFRIIIFLLTVSLLSSCESSFYRDHSQLLQAFKKDNPSYSLIYESSPESDTILVTLFAEPDSGNITGLVSYNNNTDQSIRPQIGNFQLLTPKGGKAFPYDSISPEAIPAGNTGHFILHFAPIANDHLFYRYTGLDGDLNDTYNVNIDIDDKHISTTCHVEESGYKIYKQQYAEQENTDVYNLQVDSEGQRAYQNTLGINDFIHAEDIELSVAGANLGFQMYERGNMLHLTVRAVNHSNYQLKVYPEVFILRHHGQLWQPNRVDDEVILRKGDRFSRKYSYKITEHPDQFELLKESFKVMINGEEKNLLKDNITFQKTDLSANNN